MPSTLAPFGLRAVKQLSGGRIPVQAYTIASGYASAIYRGTPVSLAADGTVVVATAGAAGLILGSFLGAAFTSTTGDRKFQPYWPASTTATDIVAYVEGDEGTIFEIQANGSLAVTNIGNHANFTTGTASGQIGSGSTVTFVSAASLTQSSASATAGQLQIVGLGRGPDNTSGDAFTVAQVKLGIAQFGAQPPAGI